MARFSSLGVFLLAANFALVKTQSFRLPRDIFPTSYNLKLVPDFEGDTFEGEVTILLRNERPIGNITLNAKRLKIKEITLDQAYGTTGYTMNATKGIIQVFYGDQELIDPGEHILHVKFTGIYGPYFYGFYKYEDPHSRVLFGTKFSPNHAREAFPCFDEPFFKSIFSIRLVKPNDSWEAISNMREIGRIETSKGIAVDFESTIPMSTYLLAWVITDYNFDTLVFNSGGRKIPLRFYKPGRKDQELSDALSSTQKALAFFENYTGIPYPLPKLDSIAVPHYRSSGMEHYGLVIYQDEALFRIHPFTSKLYHSIEAHLLIFHEISHMWFGNLVTHEWYNDLWLTEGFARFMQYKAGLSIFAEPFLEYWFQEVKLFTLFQLKCYDDTETAMYPRRLQDIGLKFGRATYEQGGAILLMLEDLMGEEKFRGVVRKHLEEHSYGYSTTGELINLMDASEPRFNVRSLMESFLFQNGLPLVNVTTEKDFFVLKQFPLCKDDNSSIFGHKWSFPVRYITSSNLTSRIVWYDREADQVKIPRNENDHWIQINNRNKGLYRSIYQRDIYISVATDFDKLDQFDVGAFIEEAFFMTAQGYIQCDIPLKLIGALKTAIKNISFLTFKYVSKSFSMFTQKLEYDKSIGKILRAYFLDIFGELYERVTWKVKPDEKMDSRLLRMAVLESFCLGTPKFKSCNPDVETMRLANESVHQDVEYIYRAVLKDSKKLNSSMVRETIGERYSTQNGTLEEQNCNSWIKKNIPKNLQP